MKMNLDEAIAAAAIAKPWNEEITIDGTDYALRRLSNADVKRMQTVGRAGDESDRQFARTMFAGETAPPVDEWGPDKLAFFLTAVTTIYAEHLAGNVAAVRDALVKQRAAQRTATSSTH
jgi:hypothetical protein